MIDQLTLAEEKTPEMAEDLAPVIEVFAPDVSPLITEDDTPVGNFPSEKQQRLLTGCLYSNLQDQTLIAAANVGIYATPHQSAIVPDVFVSFGVQIPENWWEKQNRCYFVWDFGKPPEIVLEIVSNKVGNELARKFQDYEQMRVSYYGLYDPSLQISDRPLRLFELRGMHYTELTTTWLEQVNLGLTLWEGAFEGQHDTWLRWCDAQGNILLTGDEQATQERARAEQERERAEQERERADRLAAFLRSQGIDPDQLPD